MQGVKAPFRAIFIDTRMAGRRPKAKASRSGRELLAAPRAARCKHLAAADRRRAGAKAVTALAHELAGLISPLHGLVSEFQSSAEKIERRSTLNAQTPTRPLRRIQPSGEPKKRTRRLRRRCKAGLMPRRREQVNRGFHGSLLHPVLAVPTPGIEAVLHLALVVNDVESPVTERDKDHDSDDGGDIAAPARMRRFILVAR
jgi:hypothetical protein